MNQKYTGVWIPAIVFDLPLSLTARVLYGIVDSLDGDEGCWASNNYLADKIGVSVRAVQEAVKELTDAGLLVRSIEDNYQRTLRTVSHEAVLRATQNLHGGVCKSCTGGYAESAHYNKEDNKEDNKEPPTPFEKGLQGIVNKINLSHSQKPKKQSVVPDLDSIPWSEPLPFDSKAFGDAWGMLVSYLEEKNRLKASQTGKKPKANLCRVLPEQQRLLWEQFKEWGEQKSIDNIRESIRRGYSTVFECSGKKMLTQGNGKYYKPLTPEDHLTQD